MDQIDGGLEREVQVRPAQDAKLVGAFRRFARRENRRGRQQAVEQVQDARGSTLAVEADDESTASDKIQPGPCFLAAHLPRPSRKGCDRLWARVSGLAEGGSPLPAGRLYSGEQLQYCSGHPRNERHCERARAVCSRKHGCGPWRWPGFPVRPGSSRLIR